MSATYSLQFYLNGALVWELTEGFEGLTWTRRRIVAGTDAFSFTLNSVLIEEQFGDLRYSLATFAVPIGLECYVVRGGTIVVGGFLATLPSITANTAGSYSFGFEFDGFLNLLDGVYITPRTITNTALDTVITSLMSEANTRASSSGNSFRFSKGSIESFNKITATFNGYKTIKAFLVDRCDNTSGAGAFDFYFSNFDGVNYYNLEHSYSFGTARSYTLGFPASAANVSAVSFSANEVGGFASKVIALGTGSTSADEASSTAIVAEALDEEAVANYGYRETLYQDSSITDTDTLQVMATSKLDLVTAKAIYCPNITLTGVQVTPSAKASGVCIWVGDTIALDTPFAAGTYRVQELTVDVSETGAETITPVLQLEAGV